MRSPAALSGSRLSISRFYLRGCLLTTTSRSSRSSMVAARFRSMGFAVAAVAAVVLALTLAACSPGSPKFKNTDITGVPYARGFELTDQNGQRRKLADFRGKVVSIFFGYTQCPDVCPTTLAEM